MAVSDPNRRRSVMLLGPMGVGKTTVATALERYGYLRYSMSEPVRRIVEIVFPWLEGESKSVRRTYYQRIGRFIRRLEPNPILYHTEMTLRNAPNPLIIDDGRTAEEAGWAVRHGLAVVVLTCSDTERQRRLIERDGTLPDLRTFQDPTEREWEGVDAPRVDTTHLSPDETVRTVLGLLGRDES